jgi:S-disulfanyl-L-cysteine oxidoreductase SoxD
MTSHRLIRIIAAAGCVIVASLAVARGAAPEAAQARTAAPAKPQPAGGSTHQPERFGIGRPATPAEIAALDIDVGPDGAGLPPGRGSSADGAPIYAARCAGCHGKTGKEGPNDMLVGRLPGDAFTFARDPKAPKTIGSYWPYATTVFDYIRRAMPPDAPGSLQDNEVYGLVAYLLTLNELIPADTVIDATSLPKVKMPAHDRFVPDTRGQPKPAAPSPRR